MSDIFSKEMKKELIKLMDSRLEIMRILPTIESHKKLYHNMNVNVKEINDRLVEVEDIRDIFENDIDDLKQEVKESITGDKLETLVAQTMLKLMPNFKITISKEIKRHLVTIAEYVIKNFNEKD